MQFSLNIVKLAMVLAMTASSVSAAPADAGTASVDSPSSTNGEDGSNVFRYFAHGSWFSSVILVNACTTFDVITANAVSAVGVPAGYNCQVFIGPHCSGGSDLIIGRGQPGDVQGLRNARNNNLSWRCA